MPITKYQLNHICSAYMEKFPMEQIEPNREDIKESISERVTEHSRKFDKQIEESRSYTEKEIREAWRAEEWEIGDTTIQAIGVSHVPETFLEFRNEIEKKIQESDIVVNEFAPEALGFYDKTQASYLKAIKSKFNENYNLEQLRQAYLKFERPWNIGVFHHEIELLAAKYGKDMACVDLKVKDPESLLQDSYLYAYGTEQVAERKAALKRAGLYGGSAALGITGLSGLLKELKKPITRRVFLKKMGLLAAGTAIAGVTPKITEVSRTPPEKISKLQKQSEDDLLERLRDPYLADSLQRLAESGYKKIAFIYGIGHLKRVKEYLDDPQRSTHELATHKEVIERNNPDAFRVYHLSPGKNNSERFIASEKMIWKRIQQEI